MNDQEAFQVAVEEARISYEEGGVPVRSNHFQYIQLKKNVGLYIYFKFHALWGIIYNALELRWVTRLRHVDFET